MKNRFFKSFPVRLSVRFMFVLTMALLVISGFLMVFINSLLYNSQETILKDAEHQIYLVIDELDSLSGFEYQDGVSVSVSVPNIPYYLTYIVYDTSSMDVLATNDPFLPLLEDTEGHAVRYYEKGFFYDGDLNVLYISKSHELRNRQIIIAVVMDMDNNYFVSFLKKIPLAFIILIAPVLILSFLVSYFITLKTISPVVKITKAAQAKTTANLDELLPLSGKGDEIDELSLTFNELFKRIKADFDRERQFSSDVSHELNTPLTVITGQTNLLLRWGKDNPEQLEKSLMAIKTESKSMHAIIDNLLQISRIETGRITPQIAKVGLDALFGRIAEELGAISTALIDCHGNGIVLNTDGEMLHQILMVFVSNSIKFAGPSCTVKLEAEVQDKMIVVKASDDGPGISEEALPHVFERFYRADEAHTRSVGGSGLGLAIAKTLSEALDAEIRVENCKPHGASFSLYFRDL
jgi:signal transduction histidine kinase